MWKQAAWKMVVSVLTAWPACAFADGLPRYLLPPGRSLVYIAKGSETRTDVPVAKLESSMEAERTITCLNENGDGSFHLVLRNVLKFKQAGGRSTDQVSLVYADLFPDGRLKPNPQMGLMMDVSETLPALPASEKEMAEGWSTVHPQTADRRTYKLLSDAGGVLSFEETKDGPMERIYATRFHDVISFDRAKGIPIGIESDFSQDYGFHIKGKQSVALQKDDMIDPARLAVLRSEYEMLFAVVSDYRAACQSVNSTRGDAVQGIAAARSLLSSALAKASDADVRGELERLIKQHDQYATSEAEEAQKFSSMLNKPGPTWSSTDLSGKAWSTQALRGNVVVMDFWYRGCGWCMNAMPQVKQLAADFADKPVIVLGMNTDAKPEDADFVVKEFDLKYPQIKARDIPDSYGIHGFPTTIVIDQQGLVRNIEIGYSPDLHDKLKKSIDLLLSGEQR